MTTNRRFLKRVTQACFSLWLVALLSLMVLPLGTASAAVTGVKPYITILCKFKDITSEPKPLTFYQQMLTGNAIPSIPSYFKEVSDRQLDLTGSQVGGWYTLPRNRAQYIVDVQEQAFDRNLLATDCTSLIDGAVDFKRYAGINLVFNGQINNGSSSGFPGFPVYLDGKSNWPMTFISVEDSLNQSVFAHEMGHTMGMMHANGSPDNDYNNVWDVMSYTRSQYDDIFGYIGQHPTVYNKYIAGWIPETRVRDFTTRASGIYNVTLQQHTDRRADSTPLMIRVQYSATKYYIIEARIRDGYDSFLPSKGVIIHDRAKLGSFYQLVDGDNDGNTADPESYLVAGETIELPIPGSSAKIKVKLNSDSGVNFFLTVTVPNVSY